MRMWRHGVAGVVVTALVLMPGLATTCLAACLRQTPATAPGAAGSAAHAHHGSTVHADHGSSTPAHTEIRVRAELDAAPAHDCRDHAGAVHWSGTVSRWAAVDRQVVSTSALSRQCLGAVGALTAHRVRSTHGPPGASAVVTPLVLRI